MFRKTEVITFLPRSQKRNPKFSSTINHKNSYHNGVTCYHKFFIAINSLYRKHGLKVERKTRYAVL